MGLADGGKYEEGVKKVANNKNEITGDLDILLVEDNELNQEVVSLFLRKVGYNLVIANNGEEAIIKLEKQHFDLILMDIEMPEMNGFECTRLIRKSDPSRLNPEIPIIAMTAHAMKGDKDKCMGAGMDDYMSKPLNFKELGEKLIYFMDKKSKAEPGSVPSMRRA